MVQIIRRAIRIGATLVGLSILIFLLARVVPGNPARLALGPEASQAQIEDLERELGLDKPVYVQYWAFLSNLAHGKLGYSLVTMRDVSKDLIQRFPATLELVLVAMTLAIFGGIPLGIVSALRKDSFLDNLSRLFALTGVSFPRYWIGIMLQLAFAYSLRLLPLTGRIRGAPPETITGLYLLDSLVTLNMGAFIDSLRHIILPAITLALSPLAQMSRLVRANMIDQLDKDYIVTMKILGMPRNLLVVKYMLKNAFTSTLTVMGLMFGWMLGNAFLVEKVFSWPGMARYGVDAVLRADFNAIVGVVIIIGLGYLVITLALDMLYGYLDPRIRM